MSPKKFKPYYHTSEYYRKKQKLLKNLCIKEQTSTISASQNNVMTPKPTQALNKNITSSSDIREMNLNESFSSYSEYSSTHENENQNDLEYSFECKLRSWAVQENISLTALNKLLKLLQQLAIPNLPTDGRTLLKTPRTTDIVELENNGKFWYNGIENCLRSALYSIKESIAIKMIINIDGIPPFKSSRMEMWPILLCINKEYCEEPMVIAIYYGLGKPPLNQFFEKFVAELGTIFKNGLCITNFYVKIQNIMFVCDTPARAFIKGNI